MPVTKEVLIERTKFLRDKQRFYEGVGLSVIGLSGAALSISEYYGRLALLSLGFILGLLSFIGHIIVEKELSSLWVDIMKDPKPNYLSVPLIALIGVTVFLIIHIIQLIHP